MILFKEKKSDPYELPFRFVPPKPNIDAILKGGIIDAKKVMQGCNEKRREYYNGTGGFTKKRTMRHMGDIPIDVLFHPELGKYFQKGADAHERKKERARFFQKFPQFSVGKF
jgi:hypothetical protein